MGFAQSSASLQVLFDLGKNYSLGVDENLFPKGFELICSAAEQWYAPALSECENYYFNGILRREVLNAECFSMIKHAQIFINA